MSSVKYDVSILLHMPTGDVKKGAQEANRILDRLVLDQAARNRKLSSEQLRSIQRSNREQTREHEHAARAAATVYEKHLGQGLFSRLGRSASDAFKRNFSMSGLTGGGGGGGLLGGALSVAGGNLITSILGGVTSQLTAGLKAGFDYNKLKEQTLLGFEIKLKGRKEAEEFFNQVAVFAEKTPLELQQALTGVQRLMATFSAPESLKTIKAVTDAVAAQGKVGGEASEQINGIGLALQQIVLKQKVSAEELTQLAERQVNGWKYLADEIARTDSQFAALADEDRVARVMDMAQKGMLNARTAVAVIVKGMSQEFGGTAERIAKETAEGMESNIKDSLDRTAGIASESAFQRYKQFLDKVNTLLQSGAGDKIAGNINGSTGAMFDALEKTLGAVAGGDLQRLGLDAVNSARDGITSGAAGLYNAATGAAGQVEQGWRDRMKQNSPSQVMLALGFDAGQSLIMGFIQGVKGPRFADEVEKIIEEAAARYGLDPNLIRAMIKQESGGNPKALSPKGARGVSQFMPDTARRYGLRVGGGVDERLDVDKSIRAMAHYMADLMKMFGGDTRLALAGYNAGEGAVKKYGGIPPYNETQNYVQSIMRGFTRLSTGVDSFNQSPSGRPVPVEIVNVPGTNMTPQQVLSGDFFSRFPGTGYRPGLALGHAVPDRPAGNDLRGGVGVFAGSENKRGFAEWLLAFEKSQPVTGKTSPLEQADYQHQISLMADQMNVSREFVRLAQDYVTRILELQETARSMIAAQGAASGGSFRPGSEFANITGEQARHVLDMVKQATTGTGLLKQEVGTLAQTVTPQALNTVRRVAEETDDAFRNLPPLIKATGEESVKQSEEIARQLSQAFGGVLQASLRGDWRGALSGLRQDFQSWLVGLFQDWAQSSIFGALTGKKGGGASGGGLLSSIGKLFGLGSSSSSASAAPAGLPFLGSPLRGLDIFGGGIGIPASQTSSVATQNAIQQALGGTSGAAGAAGKFSFSALGESLGPMLPLLGLGLGATLGGQSRGGNVLGAAGGLLGGLGLAAILAPSSAGALGLGTVGAALGITSATAMLAATFGIGGALLVGAHLLARNAARRRDEKTRDALSNDTGTAIWQLIGQAGAGDLGLAEAQQQFNAIKTRYFEGVNQIKDSKTKRHANLQWQNDFAPLWKILEMRAREGEENKKRFDAFIPTFARGGAAARGMGGAGGFRFNPRGLVRGPGTSRSDSILAYFPAARTPAFISNTEYVLDADTTRNIGVGKLDSIRASKGRGLAEGGSVTPGAGASWTPAPIQINLGNITIVLGKEDQTRIFVAGGDTAEGRAVIASTVMSDYEKRGPIFQTANREQGRRR